MNTGNYVQGIIQGSQFFQVFSSELAKYATDNGQTALQPTDGFFAIVTEASLNEKEYFESFCSSECRQDEILIHNG